MAISLESRCHATLNREACQRSVASVDLMKKNLRMMTKFLIAEEDQEPEEDLTLKERVTRLEKRLAMLEAYDGAVG